MRSSAPRFSHRPPRRAVQLLAGLVAALTLGILAGTFSSSALAVGDYQYQLANQVCAGGQSNFNLGYGIVRWNTTVNAGSYCYMGWGNTGSNASVFKLHLNHSRDYSGTGSRVLRVAWNDFGAYNDYDDGAFVTHQEPGVGGGYNAFLQVIQTATRTYSGNTTNSLANGGDGVYAHVSDNEGPNLSGISVSCPSGGANGWCRGSSATASFTSSDNYLGRQATYLYIDGGGPYGGWDQSVTSHSYTINAGDGGHTFQARRGGDGWGTAAVDQAFYIDGSAPSAPSSFAVNPAVGGGTQSVTASWGVSDAVSGAANGTVEINSATDGSASGSWTSACTSSGSGNGTRSCSFATGSYAQGTHQLRVSYSDVAGNGSSYATTTLVVDQTAPSVPSVSGGSSSWVAGPVTLSASGSTDSGGSTLAGYQYRASNDGGVNWVVGGAGGTNGSSLTLGNGGDWVVQFRAYDGVGNISAWSSSAQARVDRLPPSPPVVSGGSLSWLNQASTTLTASGSSDGQSSPVTYESRVSTDGGSSWSAPAAGASRTITAAGETLVQFRALDALGTPSTWVWAQPDAVRADNPLAYYRFDESSGTGLVDSSGNGRSGLYVGGPTLGVSGRPSSGEGNTAVKVAGATSYGTVPAPPITSAFTFEVWMKVDAITGAWQTVFDRGACCGESYALYVGPSGELHGATYAGSSRQTWQTAAGTIAAGTWYHVVWTYDGATQKAYLNGNTTPVASGAASGAVVSNTDQLLIGRRAGDVTAFAGTLDELAIYGTALSSTRVAAHFNAGPSFAAGTARLDREAPTASLTGGSSSWTNASKVTLNGSGSDDAGASFLTYQHRVSRDNGATWLSPVTGADPVVPSPAGVPNLSLWLRADQISSTQGASVASWSDSSSNAQGATQPNSAYQPTYQASAINGKPALRFDGSNDFLTNGSLSLGSQVSVFAVAKPSSSSTAAHRRIINNEANLFFGSYDSSFASFYGDGNSWGSTANHGFLSTLSNGTPYVLTSVNNGTDNAYVNGALVDSRTNAMGAFSDGYQVGCLTLGGATCWASSPQAWDGDIAEIIVVNRAVTTAERQEIERYLLDKYGLNVPPSHRSAGEGTTLVQVRATDRAGQSSTWAPAHAGAPSSPDASGTVRIDRTPPSNPTVSGGSTSFRNVAGLSLTASGSTDTGGAALTGYQSRVSTDNGSSWSTPTSGATFTENGEADDLVQMRSVDGAGNASAWVSADYRGEVLSDNPVGYWRLNEGTGTATDSSGYANNGNYAGASTATGSSALAFDTNGSSTFTGGLASGGYVDVPSTTTLSDLRAGWTADGWVKTTSSSQPYQMLVEKYPWNAGASAGNGGFAVRLQNNQLSAYNIVGQGYDYVLGSTVLATDTWYHFAAAYDPVAKTIKVYLNGVLDGSASAPTAPLTSSPSLKIGAEGDNSGWRVLGQMDDVAVYPSALSQSRIAAHYAAGASRWSAYDTVRAYGAAGFWRLGESSGATAADSSGNDLSGTYAGSYTQGAVGSVISDSSDTATTFNGGYVSVPDAAALRPAQVSVQAWVKTTDGGIDRVLVTKTNAGCGTAGYVLRLHATTTAGQPAFWVPGLAGGYLSAGAGVTVNDGNWHQIIGTWNGSTARLYVDGVLRNSATGGSANSQSTGTLYIGSGAPVSCGNALAGSIDEVAVYPSALSANQVSELYGASAHRFSRIRIERTGPVPSVSGGSLAWQSVPSVTVSASGASAASGVTYQYRTSTNGGSTWSSAASGGSLAVSSEGETLVQFRARSNAGLVSAWLPAHSGAPSAPDAAGTVRIDRTAPSAPTVTGGSATWQSSASVTVNAAGSTDTGGSGVTDYQFQTSTDRGATWSATQSGTSFTQTSEGETLVRFRAVDGAGNASAWADAYSSQVAKDTPAVYYRFGETSGTSLADASGKGATGTLGGSGMSLGQSNGLFADPADKSLSLSGSSGYAITPNLISTTSFPSSSTTVEVWFKANAPGDVVVELGTNAINSSWHDSQIEVLAGGVVKGRFWNLGVMTLGTVTFGTWHHAVIRFDSTTNTQDGFLDGVKVSGGSGTIRSTPYPPGGALGLYYALGATDTTNLGSGAYLNGSLDEFAVYPTALSDARIQAHYQAGVAPTGLIRIERNDPSAPSVSGGDLAWQSVPSLTFTASGSTAGSGIANYQYRTSTDGGSSWSSATDLASGVNTYAITAEGQTLIQFRAKSVAGRFSAWAPSHAGAPASPSAAGTSRIDRTAPSTPTVSGGSMTWVTGSVNFTPSGATDTGGSGLAGHDIRIWGSGDTAWGSPTTFASPAFSMTTEGRSRIQIRARDGAGNTSAWSPSYSNTVLSDSPKAYWRLDEASGNALDASGNGNALVYGAGVTRGAASLLTSDPDPAATFNGTATGQATTGTSISGLSATNASLEAWVSIPSLPNRGAFVKVGSSGGWGVGIGGSNFDDQGSQLYGLYENVSWIPSGYSFPSAGVYHVVMTIDGSSVARFYVNGSLVATRSGYGTPGAPTGNVGVGGYGGVRNFTGTVDEAAVYPSALTAGQVSAHYQTGSSAANVASLDNLAPTAPTVAGGSLAWQNVDSVTVSASGSTDASSGLAGYEYRTSTNGGSSWSAAAAGTSVSVSSEGETLVQFRAKDVLGNASTWTPAHDPSADAAGTVRIDRSSPVAPQVSASPLAWTNGAVHFTATGSDPGGVQRFEYRTSLNGGAWTAPSAGTTLDVTDEGITRVQFRIVDRAGKTSPWTWATPDQVRQLSPSLYYRLGDAGATAVDHSGNGRDGTYSGGSLSAAAAPVTGDEDGSRSLTGSGYVAAPTMSSLTSSSFTVSGWFRVTALSGIQTIFNARSADANGKAISLSVQSSGDLRFDFYNQAITTPFMIVQPGTWHHVAATFDIATGAQNIYLDGTLRSNGSASGFTGTAPVINLGRSVNGSNYLNGDLDEFAVYPAALTQGQVQSLKNAGPDFAAATARIDKTPPATPTLPGGSGSWTNATSVTKTVAAVSDPTGSGYDHTEYQVSTDAGANWGAWTTGLSVTVTDPGQTLIRWRALDVAGNASAATAPYTVGIDRTPADAPTVTGGSDDWQNVASVTLHASASADGAPIAEYVSRISGDGGQSWSATQGGQDRQVSAEGDWRVQFKVVDEAGNESAWSPAQPVAGSRARIDRTPPSRVPNLSTDTQPNAEGYFFVDTVTVTASGATDAVSGVHHYEHRVSHDQGQTWSTGTGASVEVSFEGETWVEFRAVDHVNLTSTGTNDGWERLVVRQDFSGPVLEEPVFEPGSSESDALLFKRPGANNVWFNASVPGSVRVKLGGELGYPFLATTNWLSASGFTLDQTWNEALYTWTPGASPVAQPQLVATEASGRESAPVSGFNLIPDSSSPVLTLVTPGGRDPDADTYLSAPAPGDGVRISWLARDEGSGLRGRLSGLVRDGSPLPDRANQILLERRSMAPTGDGSACRPADQWAGATWTTVPLGDDGTVPDARTQTMHGAIEDAGVALVEDQPRCFQWRLRAADGVGHTAEALSGRVLVTPSNPRTSLPPLAADGSSTSGSIGVLPGGEIRLAGGDTLLNNITNTEQIARLTGRFLSNPNSQHCTDTESQTYYCPGGTIDLLGDGASRASILLNDQPLSASDPTAALAAAQVHIRALRGFAGQPAAPKLRSPNLEQAIAETAPWITEARELPAATGNLTGDFVVDGNLTIPAGKHLTIKGGLVVLGDLTVAQNATLRILKPNAAQWRRPGLVVATPGAGQAQMTVNGYVSVEGLLWAEKAAVSGGYSTLNVNGAALFGTLDGAEHAGEASLEQQGAMVVEWTRKVLDLRGLGGDDGLGLGGVKVEGVASITPVG